MSCPGRRRRTSIDFDSSRVRDRKSTRLNSSHSQISYAVFCLKKKIDFIEAENSMGFPAPQEAARVLVRSIDYTSQGQAALRGLTVSAPPPPGGTHAARRPSP